MQNFIISSNTVQQDVQTKKTGILLRPLKNVTLDIFSTKIFSKARGAVLNPLLPTTNFS